MCIVSKNISIVHIIKYRIGTTINPNNLPYKYNGVADLHVSWLELVSVFQGRGYMAHNSYTMCIRGLPDMYTLSPRASGVHIRQTTHAHGITITCMYILYTSLSFLSFS